MATWVIQSSPAPANSSDSKYNGLDSPDVSVTNLDDVDEESIFSSGFE